MTQRPAFAIIDVARQSEYQGIELPFNAIGVVLVDREPTAILTCTHLRRYGATYSAQFLDGSSVPNCTGRTHYTVVSRNLRSHFGA